MTAILCRECGRDISAPYPQCEIGKVRPGLDCVCCGGSIEPPQPEPIALKRRSTEDRLLYILRKASEAIEKGDGRLCADILRATLLMEEME